MMIFSQLIIHDNRSFLVSESSIRQETLFAGVALPTIFIIYFSEGFIPHPEEDLRPLWLSFSENQVCARVLTCYIIIVIKVENEVIKIC